MACSINKSLAAALAVILVSLPAAAEGPPSVWPERVVAIEELRPLTGLRLKVPGSLVKGTVRGPAVLRVHLDTAGAVVRAVLLQSCGNTDLDEAALHAMRAMRFQPHVVEGTPTEVSLAVPVYVPKQLGRSW